MIYLYDYRSAKSHHEERVSRSLRKAMMDQPFDSYVSPVTKQTADIVEVEFGTWCDSQPMGA